ncbi:hypothetical protein MGYG_05269 [Nannizzia gypsea CBS 118893]|uniref:Uncharacterized protein n=1 Tax=Arthroderma gypseum (strain ATCC MYA-4604 / CBS 118893) TaxID=535722 RepID=E4UVE1_ARTGP|nr:hypothetical protein MGYG_05269 [Nannizzia gypsea CBS 118893]EFR02268.1 hypothetical protein MGYG_05269 [Nannizzia gypsea CBS 118893]
MAVMRWAITVTVTRTITIHMEGGYRCDIRIILILTPELRRNASIKSRTGATSDSYIGQTCDGEGKGVWSMESLLGHGKRKQHMPWLNLLSRSFRFVWEDVAPAAKGHYITTLQLQLFQGRRRQTDKRHRQRETHRVTGDRTKEDNKKQKKKQKKKKQKKQKEREEAGEEGEERNATCQVVRTSDGTKSESRALGLRRITSRPGESVSSSV